MTCPCEMCRENDKRERWYAEIHNARQAVIDAAKAWVEVDYGEIGELEAGLVLIDAVHELDVLENK